MTKEEAIKELANTKVYVDGKSKEIQEKLFSLGYKWQYGGNTIQEIDAPFLFMDANRTITCMNIMGFFTQHKNREITVDDILNITIDKLPYRPFENEKECWKEMLKHYPFGWITGSPKYHLILSVDNVYIWVSDNVYYTFEEAFNTYKFADGTPFGIKGEE